MRKNMINPIYKLNLTTVVYKYFEVLRMHKRIAILISIEGTGKLITAKSSRPSQDQY